MREMKDSGIEWIGNVPKDWEIVRIKEKYPFNTGFTPDTQQSNYYNDENGYEWATIADIVGGKVNTPTKSLVSRSFIEQYHKEIIKPNSLLYSFKLSVGQTAITDRPMYTNEALASFEQTSENNIGFLKYSSLLIEYNANTNIYGAKILNQQLIKNAYVTFPNLQEQCRIADFLDEKCGEIDSLTKDIQEQIETLEEYKKSVITEAVTKGLDPNVEMKDSGIEWIGKIARDANVFRLKFFSYMKGRIGWQGLKASDFIDEGPYCVTGTDFINGKVNWESCYHVSEERYSMDSNIHIKEGDLLMTKDGTIGKLAVVDKLPGKACLNSHLLIIRPLQNKYKNKYLYYIMKSHLFSKYYTIVSTGSIMDSLSQEKTGNFAIPIFSAEKQQQIISYLDSKCSEIDAIIQNKKEQLDVLAEYKKSLIYEYVTGKKEVPVND